MAIGWCVVIWKETQGLHLWNWESLGLVGSHADLPPQTQCILLQYRCQCVCSRRALAVSCCRWRHMETKHALLVASLWHLGSLDLLKSAETTFKTIKQVSTYVHELSVWKLLQGKHWNCWVPWSASTMLDSLVVVPQSLDHFRILFHHFLHSGKNNTVQGPTCFDHFE